MMIDKDLLIRKVAESHKFVLTDDDPIIATTLLHEVIFEMHAQALSENLEAQNAKTKSMFQLALSQSRMHFKVEIENIFQSIKSDNAISVQAHKSLLNELSDSMTKLTLEADRSKNSAWWAMVGVTVFGFVTVLLNFYLTAAK